MKIGCGEVDDNRDGEWLRYIDKVFRYKYKKKYKYKNCTNL
jgi:hypothetical protein